MSDIQASKITPTSAVTRTAPVAPVHRDVVTKAPGDRPAASPSTVVASTSGSLRSAYAQYVVDPTTHDTVVRIRDTNTGAVISESPTPEVQAMLRALKEYADTAARQQLARQTGLAH